MTIVKKGSRRIRVGSREYRWTVRKKPTYQEAAFQSPMRLVIERVAAGSRCVLRVELGISRPDNWVRPHKTSLTPSTVADIIRQALKAGWDPSGVTRTFELEYRLTNE